MNVAHLITAVTFVVGAGSAFAYDDVQRFPTPSTTTRVEAQAAAQGATTGARQIGEATVFVDRGNTSERSRAEVAAEARQASKNLFNALFVGA